MPVSNSSPQAQASQKKEEGGILLFLDTTVAKAGSPDYSTLTQPILSVHTPLPGLCSSENFLPGSGMQVPGGYYWLGSLLTGLQAVSSWPGQAESAHSQLTAQYCHRPLLPAPLPL